jgi:PKD repeat protein
LYLLSQAAALAGIGSNLIFLENKGQWPEHVRFRAEVNGHSIWLDSNRLTYQIRSSSLHPLQKVHDRVTAPVADRYQAIAHVYEVIFIGGKTQAIRPKSIPSSEFFNFIQGEDSKKWVFDAHSYTKVGYQQVYKGIDLTLYGSNGRMKYDFELAPGNNGQSIRLQYKGLNSIRLEGGKLILKTALGQIVEEIPKAYQLIDGVAKMVECQFTLTEDVVGFRFNRPLDTRYKTIIDPVLNFFTYSGASSDNWANTAVSDKEGNSYTAGTVYGNSFPNTTGAIDRSYNGGSSPYLGYDIGILKFDKAGGRLLWGTFFGGSSAETPHALKIDENQHLVVMGTTSSTNFPTTTNAYQRNFNMSTAEYPFGFDPDYVLPTYRNGSELFISKINSDGKSLIASTLFGGNGADGLLGIDNYMVANYGDQFRGDVEIGPNGEIFLASNTQSTTLPLKNAYQNTLNGKTDGLIARFSSDLSELKWSTYFGGLGDEAIFSLALTSDLKLAICGATTSNNFPTTGNAVQPQRLGNSNDGFLALFEGNSGNLLNSTYLSTPAFDQAYLVDVDYEDFVYVFGQTQGNMPLTENRFGTARGGQFLQKFRKNLDGRVWATTYGSTPNQPNIVPTALMVDSCKRIFMAGWGGRVNYQGNGFAGGYTIGLPVSTDALQPTTADSSDFYFLVLGADAGSLVYGTYFGSKSGRGEHVDGGTSHFDRKGVITHAVCGCMDRSGNYQRGTPGAYRTQIGSDNCNNGVMKLNLLDLKAKFEFNGRLECPSTLTLFNQSENGETYTWYFGNGDSLVSANSTVRYTYDIPGTYVITLKAVNPRTCQYSSLANDTITIPNPFPFEPQIKSDLYCVGDTLKPIFENLEGYQVKWEPATYLSDPTIYNPIVVPLSSITYKVKAVDLNGCQISNEFKTQNRKFQLGFGWDKTFDICKGIYTVHLYSNRDVSDRYVWYFQNGDTATGTDLAYTYTQNGKFWVRLNGSYQSCEDNAIDTIRLNEEKISILPEFTAERVYSGCEQPEWVFKNKTKLATAFIWDFGDGYKSTETEPIHKFENPGVYEVKLDAFQHVCSDTKVKTLIVDEVKVPNLITFNKDGKNETFQIAGLQPGWGLEIFDRWGHRVYKTNDYKNDWMPDLVQEGIYFYNLTFPGGTYCNGWINAMK